MAHLMDKIEQLAKLILKIRSPDRPFVVLIAGASASGKSTVSERLVNLLDRVGAPLPRIGGHPTVLSADMFYRDDTKTLSSLRGGNYDHPLEISSLELESTIRDLLEGKEVYLPVYSFKEGRRIDKVGPVLSDENPIIVVEGLYTIGLLSHLSNLNVFVETQSKMELFIRRMLRDVVRAGSRMEEVVRQIATALAMWNIYGDSQRRMADVIYRSTYRVLEEKGTRSYQIKVKASDFEEIFPGTMKELEASSPVEVEDLIIGNTEEMMVGRLYLDGYRPSSFEISYRSLSSSDLPFVRSMRLKLDSSTYTAFVILSQIMGYRPRVLFRKIHRVERDCVSFKYYPERGVVEIDTAREKDLDDYIRKLRGFIHLHSYYSGLGF